MYAILNSPNQFWFIERITFTVLTTSTLVAFFAAYKRIASYKEQILKDTERWYLVLSAVHLIFQFIYNFVIGSTFFLYFAYVILYIELLCINDTFTTHLEGVSNNLKGYIETITKYGTLTVLVFGIVLVLQIESNNQCGQNLLTVNLSIYTAITIFTAAELVFIVKKKNQKLNRMTEDRSYNMSNDLKEELQAKQDGVKSLMHYKLFFIKLTYVVTFGYFINAVLYSIKLMPVAYENKRCNDLFESKPAIFSFFFSISEFLGLNLLNLFVYYQYYWIRRHEFSLSDEKVILNEVFDNDRSGYIRELVDDDDNEFGHRN